MRPKKPPSISRLSFSSPGRNSLSCTTPWLTPASRGQPRQLQRGRDGLGAAASRSRRACRPRSPPGPPSPGPGSAARRSRSSRRRGPARRRGRSSSRSSPWRSASSRAACARCARPGRARARSRPVGERDAALLADGEQRADQVLAVAHPPGHAVHDDSDPPHRRGAYPAGPCVLWRTTREVASSTRRSVSWPSTSRAAVAAISVSGWRIVVSGGHDPARHRQVVEADDAEVVGHAEAEHPRRLVDPERLQVRAGEDRGRAACAASAARAPRR